MNGNLPVAFVGAMLAAPTFAQDALLLDEDRTCAVGKAASPTWTSNDGRHQPRSHGFLAPRAICIMLFCLALTLAIPGCARPADAADAYVRSVAERKESKAAKLELIRREFADQPTKLIDIVLELDFENDDLTTDISAICRDGLADLLPAEDYALLCDEISTAPGRARGVLAGVLPQSKVLIAAVKRDPKAVIQLLTDEKESLNAIAALAEVLARAEVPAVTELIRSKLRPNHMNHLQLSLEVSLIRLRDEATREKYEQMLESERFTDQTTALMVFAQSESPSVMKYLIPWLEVDDYPDVGRHSDPPFRYRDVPVRFANFFRGVEPEPISFSYWRTRSDAEVAQVRKWWSTVKDRIEYR